MSEILGTAKTVKELLSNSKFYIDYYQREYLWSKKQVQELLEDLSEKFLEKDTAGESFNIVKSFPHYFLGSIIINNNEEEKKKYIVDGQQRLTTLTLILIYIYQNIPVKESQQSLVNLIFSDSYGKKGFNIDVEERNTCMEAILEGKEYLNDDDVSISARNLQNRFADIKEQLPQSIDEEKIMFFSYWLLENVHLIEIQANTDNDSYTIFETMNDRGLSLSSTDMLKGYLLANIKNSSERNELNDLWLNKISELNQISKDEPANSVKAWLRSQHAETYKQGGSYKGRFDFSDIGTEFHRWVRDKKEVLQLNESSDFVNFIKEDFLFYINVYKKLREYSNNYDSDYPEIYFNSLNGFSLQYAAILSGIDKKDSEYDQKLKIQMISKFIDIFISRYTWNFYSTGYNHRWRYIFADIILKIRRKSVNEISEYLIEKLDEEQLDIIRNNNNFSNNNFALNGKNRSRVHRLLARITEFIETNSGKDSSVVEYLNTSGQSKYEIEHIYPNHPDLFENQFDTVDVFNEYRNKLGGLLLLPKSFNASLGDKVYKEKKKSYVSQNYLAASLNADFYENNPGFNRFTKKYQFEFKPIEDFTKESLLERQILYTKIAEKIWSSDNLKL